MYSQQISKLMDLLEKELGTRRIFRANQLELERRKLDQELYKQRLINEGLANVEGVKNIGALARQRLMNESSSEVENIRGRYGLQQEQIKTAGQKDVASIGAESHKYGYDQNLAGEKYKADLGLRGHELTSAATIRASENRLAGDYERAQAERDKAKTVAGDPGSEFIMEVLKSDPTIVDDPKKWANVQRVARELRPNNPPLPEGDITMQGAATPPPVGTTTPPATDVPRAGRSMEFRGEGSPMAVDRAPRARSIEEFTPWAKKKKKGWFDF